jgi:hypothetical protein
VEGEGRGMDFFCDRDARNEGETIQIYRIVNLIFIPDGKK